MSGRNKDAKGTDELKNMLMSFRIAELQTLLATCGRSRSGRKHELLGRAVSLLKSSEGSAMRERVKSRILELYHQRYANGTAATPTPPSLTTNGTAVPSAATSYSTQSFISYTSEQYTHGHNRGGPTNNGNNKRLYPTPQAAIHQPPAPTNPNVKFITLPFFELQDILYAPISLQAKTISGFQDQIIQYHLTPYQTQLITNSRSAHIKSMIEYSVQVQLRFCVNESSKVQEDAYPTRCKIIVNGKGIPLPGQPPPNAQNQEPRKPHRPVNITSYCRLSPMQSNQIQVQWLPSDTGKRFVATIHLVKIVQVETLIQNLEAKEIRSKAHSLGFIKEKLSPDADSDISMTSLKVSLCCPISRTRMKMPCRGTSCTHLQCFDGSTYIQMNERKPSWVCPVCDQKAYYDDLFKDGLFMSIIAEATSCEDIVFFEDGSWRPLEDIHQGGGEAEVKPLPETPKSTTMSKPASVTTNICDTPPVLTIATPETSNTHRESPRPPVSTMNIPPMPSLDPTPIVVNGGTEQNTTPAQRDEEVEVIVLDDSDDEITTTNTSLSAVTGVSDLQGLELYKMLPHEDRIAAAMYLDRNGIMGRQLSNGGSSPGGRPPVVPVSVIDISDE